jgi:hypothetical protein
VSDDVDAIRARLERDYCDAFSTKDPRRVLPFYKAGLVVFHERDHGRNRDVKLFNGNALAALLRGAIPMRIAFGVVYRKLAKLSYDHSRMHLQSLDQSDGATFAQCSFERVDRSGNVFEKTQARYRLENIGGTWLIAEVWLTE